MQVFRRAAGAVLLLLFAGPLLSNHFKARADESSAAIREFAKSTVEQLPGWRLSCNREALIKYRASCDKHSDLAKDLTARPTPEMAPDIQEAIATLGKLDLKSSEPPTTGLCQPEAIAATGCLVGLNSRLMLLEITIRAKSPK